MNEPYFLYVLDHLTRDTSEIYFHPARFSSGGSLTPEERQCQIEFETLTSRAVIERIKVLNIKLINYFDMEAAR